MLSDAERAFLRGLRVDGDAVMLDGEQVCFVMGHTGRQLSTDDVALALVTAAHEWATWQGVIAKAGEWLGYRRDALETGSQDIAEAYMMADDAFTAAIDAALKEGK